MLSNYIKFIIQGDMADTASEDTWSSDEISPSNHVSEFTEVDCFYILYLLHKLRMLFRFCCMEGS